MERYNAQMVNDFINGCSASGYNLLELANDYDFMVFVFEQTSDKTMYHLCSLDLRKNYQFVKYLVNKFSDDLEFIEMVSSYYLENYKTDANVINLLLIMSFLSRNKAQKIKYESLLEELYSYLMQMINVLLDDMADIEDYSGMGFIFIKNTFSSSILAINYFAQKFISFIFDWNRKNKFEKYLHEEYRNYEAVLTAGINTVLINYIRMHDECLADYISVNIYLLSAYRGMFDDIASEWDIKEDEFNKKEVAIEPFLELKDNEIMVFEQLTQEMSCENLEKSSDCGKGKILEFRTKP